MDNQREEAREAVDPLAEELNQAKITNNLTKEVSFSNAVNQLESLEAAIAKQYTNFTTKITKAENKQKEAIK